MDGKKVYSISINGISESTKAVESLNKQLEALESRIKALEKNNVKISGGGSKSSSSALSEEIELQKELNKLKKEEAAQQRLVANEYANTMKGMKQNLADLKSAINTTDLGDTEKIKKMTKDANDLTNKLKQMEQAYGQYGRNVGNYANGVAEGLKKIRVNVGGTVREFDNARQASRTLNNELKAMAVNGQQDTQEFKNLRQAVLEMESTMNDAKKPMDNLMDTMESFVAIASAYKGIGAFFGVDDAKIQKSIQQLLALQTALKGIQTIQKQMQTREGLGKFLASSNTGVDKFVARLTGAKVTMDGLTKSSKTATVAVRGLSLALKGIGIGVVMYAISKLIDGFSNIAKDVDTAEKQTKRLDESLNALNRTYKERNDLLASAYLKGGISDEQFLAKQYQNQTDYLSQQITLLRERAALMSRQNEFGGFFSFNFMDTGTRGGNFTGNKMNGSSTVESYSWISDLIPMLKVTTNNIKEVEEEFNKCNEAIKNNEDYFSKWGNGVVDWVNSLFTTVSDTERVLTGLGNIRLSDFIGSFAEVNEQFKKGVEQGGITAEEYAKKIGELRNELNSSSVLNSVIANLDKYIPDEGVREAINNIINEIIKLDDAFNMTSPAQVHHWMQVRIDGMKEGSAKINAQIDADEKYEIEQYGKTQEQIDLIHKKYQRKRLDEIQKYNEQAKQKAKQHAKEMDAVDKELNSLRIQNMQDGLAKQIAQLEEERRQKLKKAKDDGIKVGELTVEINKLYDKKVEDTKKEWSDHIQQVYIDMWNKIYNINHSNAQKNFSLIEKEIEDEYNRLQDSTASKFNDADKGYSNKGVAVNQTKNGNYKVLVETDESYTKRLKEEFIKRTEDRKAYYDELEKIDKERAEKEFNNNIEKLKEAKNNELTTLKNSYFKEDLEMQAHLKKGEITQKQYDEWSVRMTKERTTKEAQIELDYEKKFNDNQKEFNKNIIEAQQKTNDAVVANLQAQMNKLESINTSEAVRDGFGFVSISATKRRNNQIIALYQKLAEDVAKEIKRLETELNRSDLAKQEREKLKETIEQLKQMLANVGVNVQNVVADTESTFGELISQIDYYASQVASALSSLVGAIGDYTDQQYENEINQLQEYIDEYEELLDKQRDITEEHKNAIDSIEDELATARGDRRAHLVDQLNAEIEAQRRAQKEEQRIEKQKKALEDKKKIEERKRNEANRKIQLTQAIINGAVSVTNALAVSPPWVGIALAAVMAAATAVEIATIQSQKFASGGVIEGKSHAQGGVKVLGGRAEVEGGEFITNKRTTSENVDLLEYINGKHRKLNIDDFIDFYSSGTIKKNIGSISPKTKFADGGVVPTLNNEYQFDDRLLTAFEDYSNRPVVVSVVDINSRQAAVKNIEVLAGLNND